MYIIDYIEYTYGETSNTMDWIITATLYNTAYTLLSIHELYKPWEDKVLVA